MVYDLNLEDPKVKNIINDKVLDDIWLKSFFKNCKFKATEYPLLNKICSILIDSENDDVIIVTYSINIMSISDNVKVFDREYKLTLNKMDLFREYRNIKIDNILKDETIKKSLDEYLEFDSNILFENKNHIVCIFGGAIRDIFANQPINDVDILCGSIAFIYLNNILLNNGYIYIDDLVSKHLSKMYQEIAIINEPKTYMKGDKKIQLIRPVIEECIQNFDHNTVNDNLYRAGFCDLISNVDLSCCGLSYDGELHENYPNAIIHAENKLFSINENAKMYNFQRCFERTKKLKDRGWTEIKEEDKIKVNRELRINNLLKYEKNK